MPARRDACEACERTKGRERSECFQTFGLRARQVRAPFALLRGDLAAAIADAWCSGVRQCGRAWLSGTSGTPGAAEPPGVALCGPVLPRLCGGCTISSSLHQHTPAPTPAQVDAYFAVVDDMERRLAMGTADDDTGRQVAGLGTLLFCLFVAHKLL